MELSHKPIYMCTLVHTELHHDHPHSKEPNQHRVIRSKKLKDDKGQDEGMLKTRYCGVNVLVCLHFDIEVVLCLVH